MCYWEKGILNCSQFAQILLLLYLLFKASQFVRYIKL